MSKHSPFDQDIYERLGPTRFSGTGFLGDDPRDWEDIVAADMRALAEHGVRIGALLAALRNVFDAAVAAQGDDVDVAPGVMASCLECRGRAPSPFPGEGTFAKHQVRVMRTSGEVCFILTELGLHLIERHHFFQGFGSPFRIDPLAAARLLGLGARHP